MQSIKGLKYRWLLPEIDQQKAIIIAAKFNISYVVAQVLLARNYATDQDISAFLFSSFEKDVAHASLLKDAQKATERILLAINNKEKILVAGDYDVDGITSSALALLCLQPLGACINFFLPHRVNDGYGLSVNTIQKAAKSGYKVVITVDNGITAFEPAKRAKELGIDLIITDHHKSHAQVPEAFAIVNPNQSDCPYPYKMLAGVGVIFKLMSLLYETINKPLIAKAYELLLLGTVADVVPLTGENRYWVRHGLAHVNKQESIALKVLKKNSNLTHPIISSTDIGFSITPQINALGRLEDARQGVRFLLESSVTHVERIGTVLSELNQARKHIEQHVLTQVIEQLEKDKEALLKKRIIVVMGSDWPAGVIGLVAGRLVGMYGKPAIILHLTKDGIAKGSCRSIEGFNIFEALKKNADLLITFGGHPQAAGLSLAYAHLEELQQRLEQEAQSILSDYDIEQKINIDAQLLLEDCNQTTLDALDHLEPFGCQNAPPSFIIKNVYLRQDAQLIKDAHVKCSIYDDTHDGSLIFFKRLDVYKLLKDNKGPFNIVAQLKKRVWKNKVSVQLTGIDISLSGAI